MNNPQAYAVPPAGREHIPIYPSGFIAIRIAQLVLSVIIMGLAAYAIYYLSYDGNSFIIAVAVMTVISSVYHLVAHFGPPSVYNYWAILGLDILFVILWLCSFALLAARVSAAYSVANDYYRYYRYGGLTTTESAWLATQAAASGLGGLEFVLFIASLIIHSIRLHQHRAAGLHCMPGVPRTVPGAPAPEKYGPALVVYPQQPQQAYYPPLQQQQQQPLQPYYAPQQQQQPQQPQQQPPPPQQPYYPQQQPQQQPYYPPQQQQQQQQQQQPSQSPAPQPFYHPPQGSVVVPSSSPSPLGYQQAPEAVPPPHQQQQQ